MSALAARLFEERVGAARTDLRARDGAARAAALAVLLLGASSAIGCGRSGVPKSDGPPPAVPVERRDIELRVEASGRLEPIRVVEVKSRASGEVLRLPVETGDRVRRGALLAEIDPRDVRNEHALQRENLQVAQAQLAVADAARRRAEELRKVSSVTEEELDKAVLEHTRARAELVKARTNLELARERMGDVTIRAPLNGTVIKKSVEVGQIIASASANVSGGTTLLEMADLSTMRVRTLVDETDIGQIKPGQTVLVTVEAHPGRIFAGRVSKVEPQSVVEQNVTMFPVLIELHNRDGLLKPGMSASVSIGIDERRQVVAVPSTAVAEPGEEAAAAVALGIEDKTTGGALQLRTRGPEPVVSSPSRPGNRAISRAPGDTAPPIRITRGEHAARRFDESAVARQPRGAAIAVPDSTSQLGFVFVRTERGPQMRPVRLGLSDGNHTEVLGGLAAGEWVYLVAGTPAAGREQRAEGDQVIGPGGGAVFIRAAPPPGEGVP